MKIESLRASQRRDGICLDCGAHAAVEEHLCLLEMVDGKRIQPPRRLHIPRTLCETCSAACAERTFRGLP